MNIIELSGISKTFGSVLAVNNLSLEVPKGSIYGFIGPNGSGKTTTIRMIMKIMYPDRGTLMVNGQDHNFERLENVGYLPEDRGLYKKMKIGELLQFHGELNKGSDLPNLINYWLERLELKAAYKEWDLKGRYDLDFDAEKIFCFRCQPGALPEGPVLTNCTVRACAIEKGYQACIQCAELKECEKDLWTRFPQFHEAVIKMQEKFQDQA